MRYTESIQPCTIKNRDIYWRRYKKQEILCMGQWCFSPLQSRRLGTSHSSPNCSVFSFCSASRSRLEVSVPHFYWSCMHCIVPKAFWIIQIVSAEECSSLTKNLMPIYCSTRSVILNAVATQCTCSLNNIYEHWLVRWSRHCSRMCIPVHSPWLPGYIRVA